MSNNDIGIYLSLVILGQPRYESVIPEIFKHPPVRLIRPPLRRADHGRKLWGGKYANHRLSLFN